jgi:HAD superfamily hydrolase (TIGR01459 family)
VSASSDAIRIEALNDIVSDFDAILCDAWGVIHNGIVAKQPAVTALESAKARGVRIIILTNAPRTQQQLADHFGSMGVRPTAYDKIISSGEVGRCTVHSRDKKKCFHLGPKIDLALFEGTGVDLVETLTEAAFIFNSGLRDNTRESPEKYLELLSSARVLGLPMICVNPDRVVHIGNEPRACAGALAEIYEGLGGEVTWIGKPYRQIYEFCESELKALTNKSVEPAKILVIGDAVATDILGAKSMGYPALFVVEGIHKGELTAGCDVIAFCEARGARPDFYINALA